MAEKYIVIGFNETYLKEKIEPYYAEIRHENESEKDAIFAYKFTEAEIREAAGRKAKELDIPFLTELMI